VSSVMSLIPWQIAIDEHLIIRGQHTPFSGKPVIHFLHGNGFCGLTYRPFLEALATDFDLIISDMPGHGDSDSESPFMGWNRTARVMASVLKQHMAQIGDVPVYLLGHSYGGVISALMVKHKLPVQGLIMLDPVIFPPGLLSVMAVGDTLGLLKNAPLAKGARARRKHWASRHAAHAALHNRGMFRGWSEASFAAHIQHALREQADGVTLKCNPEREAQIFSSYPRKLWASLASVHVPMVLFEAEKSFPFIAKSTERLAVVNHRLQLHKVKGGHCFMQEQPQQSARQVLAAIQTLEK
jgi:pimeloyl-ACP methyl ester carboxylesterase